MRAERRGAQARPRLYFFLGLFLRAVTWRRLLLSFVFLLSFLTVGGVGGHYDRLGRSGRKVLRYIETATAAAMALRAACSGIEI